MRKTYVVPNAGYGFDALGDVIDVLQRSSPRFSGNLISVAEPLIIAEVSTTYCASSACATGSRQQINTMLKWRGDVQG